MTNRRGASWQAGRSAGRSLRNGGAMALLGGLVLALVAAGASVLATAAGAAAGSTATVKGSTLAATGVPLSVRVSGNRLVNGSGQPIRLLGVDRSGTEYACIQGWGIFDGPSNATSVSVIAGWHTNAVRVPLNEDCWLGINGVNPAYGGTGYRTAVESYVHLLNSYGLVAILDLHWNAPGTTRATGQQIMADATHAPAFWTSVATAFKSNPAVVFDLYNEPHTVSWSCWLHGCTTSAGWAAAGMQTLLDAVRATGATQPVMAAGLGWAGDLSTWLTYEPVDPLHQLVASVHIYNFSGCNTVACWNRTIAPVAAKVPVVTGELGENDCRDTFVNGYMNWADSVGVSYLGWTWDAGGGWSCTNGPSLITGYTGSPTPFGVGLKTHLAALAGGSGGSGTTGGTTGKGTTGGTTGGTSGKGTTGGTSGGPVSVTYSVTNSWTGGLQGQLALTDTGSAPVGSASSPWTLTVVLPAGTTVTSLWNGTMTHQAASTTGTTITVEAPSWQQALEPGASWNVGFVANGPGGTPTGCVLDGSACTVSGPGGGGAPPPAPKAQVSPSSLQFAATTVGRTAPPQRVTVGNNGNAPLDVSTVSVGGSGRSAFAVTSTSCRGATVAPGASCSVWIGFSPTAAGDAQASLSVADNAAGSPQDVALSGTGLAPPPPPPPPGGGVSVAYSVANQWPGGLQGQLALTNHGTATVGSASSPWTLTVVLPPGTTVSSLWNGTMTHQSVAAGGTTVTVVAPSWQASLAPGSTWDVGFVATGPGGVPTGCVLDGSACTVSGP